MRTPRRPGVATIALSALLAGLVGLGSAAPAYAATTTPTTQPAKSKGGSKSCTKFFRWRIC